MLISNCREFALRICTGGQASSGTPFKDEYFLKNLKWCDTNKVRVYALQTTFEYDSKFWTNKKTLNGLTQNETKLASYHNTPFKKVCLGMTRNNITNWILVNYTATSLYSVIAGDGNCSETNVGRAKWMSLINDTKLQPHCNKEGFNVQCSRPGLKSRIGILGNNEDDCTSCDSVIGFGIKIWNWKGSSGNIYYKNIDIKTFGYIFVQ